jgi:hypothetical protein
LTAALARLNNESLIMVKFRPVAAAALSALLGLGIVWCADAHAERHLFNAYDLMLTTFWLGAKARAKSSGQNASVI